MVMVQNMHNVKESLGQTVTTFSRQCSTVLLFGIARLRLPRERIKYRPSMIYTRPFKSTELVRQILLANLTFLVPFFYVIDF